MTRIQFMLLITCGFTVNSLRVNSTGLSRKSNEASDKQFLISGDPSKDGFLQTNNQQFEGYRVFNQHPYEGKSQIFFSSLQDQHPKIITEDPGFHFQNQDIFLNPLDKNVHNRQETRQDEIVFKTTKEDFNKKKTRLNKSDGKRNNLAIKSKDKKSEGEIIYGKSKNGGAEHPDEFKIFPNQNPFQANLRSFPTTNFQLTEDPSKIVNNFNLGYNFAPEALYLTQDKIEENLKAPEKILSNNNNKLSTNNAPILQWKETPQGIFLDEGTGHLEGTENKLTKDLNKVKNENFNKPPKRKQGKKYKIKTKMTKQDDESNKKIINDYSSLFGLEKEENTKYINKNNDRGVVKNDLKGSSTQQEENHNLNDGDSKKKITHHSLNENTNNKGYDKEHYIDSKKSEHHLDENYKDKKTNKSKEKSAKHHADDYITKIEESEKANKKEKFLEKEGHKKGHKTRGYNNKFHRDELHREHKFYDDDDKMLYHKKKEQQVTSKTVSKHPIAYEPIRRYNPPVQRIANLNIYPRITPPHKPVYYNRKYGSLTKPPKRDGRYVVYNRGKR